MKRPENLKVGDRFTVSSPRADIAVDTVLVLYNDDLSTCPYFTDPDGNEVCESFEYLSPLAGNAVVPNSVSRRLSPRLTEVVDRLKVITDEAKVLRLEKARIKAAIAAAKAVKS